jgi:hypothetical protein
MKKPLIISGILSMLLFGCVSTGNFIKNGIEKRIPKNADKVTVKSSADNLFKRVKKVLIHNGCRIDNQNKTMKSITTEGKDIGKGVIARYKIFIKESTIIGEASYSTVNSFGHNYAKAKWSGGSEGRPKRAFASLVGLLQKIDHQSINFKKN